MPQVGTFVSVRRSSVIELQQRRLRSNIQTAISSNSRDQTDERLDKLEQSLLAMSEALIAMRFQIGSLTSVVTSFPCAQTVMAIKHQNQSVY